ncbi:uncharacterized protein FA14DRAFT_158583 [Meira miltonrushii]|uniref:Uncharacterized protein n=1 Tax=Meira miltonrushii TaxID=1280837 RepID=A0A316V5I6_9BASI|nr:uncharacterized protein FA14DRAFT_158583 [Meira miltonrushii]PWN31771.1 hypothetical protein FA14DRAFT_158583 [Meira miltonrushii]
MAYGQVEQGISPLISLLRIIFSQADLIISLAGPTEAERDRKITFYDEIVPISIRLRIPASNRTLPAPSDDSLPNFNIPLTVPDANDDEYDEGEEYGQRSQKPPLLLALLLSFLRVNVEAAYVPPRLQRSATNIFSHAETESSSSTQLIASVAEDDTAYQSVRLQGLDANMEATRMFSSTWMGNAIPPKSNIKKPSSGKGKEAFAAQAERGRGANVTFTRQGDEEYWTVEWQCQMPVIFLRSRHPNPAIVVNSEVVLQLQASKLSSLAPSLVPVARTTAPEALFLHDLLSPLSEGPSYPDESHTERAARADASLAKLPLGKLPSSVLGSKLVTPARGAKDVGKLIEEKLQLANGDMGDAEEYNSLKQGRRDLTDEGLMNIGENDGINEDPGLGEDLMVVKRSARKALDVRSAVQVRMRTTNIAGVGEGFGQNTSSDGDNGILPTLVLCVEIENPANSGIRFRMDDISVQATLPSEVQSGGNLHPSARIHVEANQIGEAVKSMVIGQGSQHNLLYRVDFSLPYMDGSLSTSDLDPVALAAETQRTITIELFGHPVLLQKVIANGVVSSEDFSPAESFTSTWSCTLDFATQIQSLILQERIAEGAGGFTLGPRTVDLSGSYDTLYEEPTPEPVKPKETKNTPTPLPIALAQKRMASAQGSPKTPLPRSSSMINNSIQSAPIRPSISRATTDTRTPSTSVGTVTLRDSPSIHRPNLRSATGGTNVSDSFVPLQQRAPDLEQSLVERGRGSLNYLRKDSQIAAMPSSMVGPSLLARARRNRQASLLASGNYGKYDNMEPNRSTSGARRSTLLSHAPYYTSGTQSKPFIRHGRLESSSLHIKNALSGSQNFDPSALPIFPLGSKANWSRLPTLVQQSGKEQGLLIEIKALYESPIGDEDDSKKELDVQVQIDNRSDFTRTVLLQWNRNAFVNKDGTASKMTFLPDDDAAQVGPIPPGQAELVVLRISTLSLVKDQGFVIPPLMLTDVESGMQQTLICVQNIVHTAS